SPWPGLARPPTSLMQHLNEKDVGARHKAGHGGPGNTGILRREEIPKRERRWLFAAGLLAALFAAGSPTAHGEEVAALYQAYWAGVPAGEIRLTMRDDPGSYRDEIVVRSQGLPWLLTHFRATAVSRSEEHTSELQSRGHLVCRLLLEKKKNI